METKNKMTRRDLLKTAVKGMGGVALGIALYSCTSINVKKLDRFIPKDMKSLTAFLNHGHCAPGITAALLYFLKIKDDYLIKLSSGMPGGLSMGLECGGITVPIMIMGMLSNNLNSVDEALSFISSGNEHLRIFEAKNHSLFCSVIQTSSNDACKNVVAASPKICLHCIQNKNSLTDSKRTAFKKIFSYYKKNDFHCTHSVLNNIHFNSFNKEKILKASWGFIGGTLLHGMTCGALTAGVLAIGEKYGVTSNQVKNVLKIMRMRGKGMDFDEKLDTYYKAQAVSKEFGRWFENEFGSTQCRKIVCCDFYSPSDVELYIENEKIKICQEITGKVAIKLKSILG